MIALDFNKLDGLVPAIVQDHQTNEVLMLAFMNEAAFENTMKTGEATYYSRSRNTLWIKGKTSGHIQIVKEIFVDCDNDSVLLKVEQVGEAACHTGYRSCFYQKIENGEAVVTQTPVFDPETVYGKK